MPCLRHPRSIHQHHPARGQRKEDPVRKKPAAVICLILCLFTLLTPFKASADERRSPVFYTLSDAAELPAAPEIAADYAILVEAKSGTILYEKNAYERAYPASTTKVLTALTAINACDDLNDMLTFSYRATHELDKGSSTIARTEGEEMTVIDCLYALLVASANEVAQGLAEYTAGSIESFCARMTLTARNLGAVNSNFSNAHGLTAEDHFTCAHDMALFMQAAIRNDTLREIMGTVSYQIAPTNKHKDITYMRCHHPLLTDTYKMKYADAVAGKTGYTDEAQNTLVTYASRGGLDLICVVMHADGVEQVGKDSASLFDYGFANFSCYDLNGADTVLSSDGSSFLSGDILDFSDAEDSFVTLPKTAALTELTSTVAYGSEADSHVAAVRSYFLNGVPVGDAPLAVEPHVSRLPIEPEISMQPTVRERLRTVYLGLPLVYWILIGGALALLLLTAFCVFITIRIKRRRALNKRRRQRAMSQYNRQETVFPDIQKKKS